MTTCWEGAAASNSEKSIAPRECQLSSKFFTYTPKGHRQRKGEGHGPLPNLEGAFFVGSDSIPSKIARNQQGAENGIFTLPERGTLHHFA